MGSYGIASAVPVGTFVHRYMGSGQVTPVYLVAGRYIGNLKVLVPGTHGPERLAAVRVNATPRAVTVLAARPGLPGPGIGAVGRPAMRSTP